MASNPIAFVRPAEYVLDDAVQLSQTEGIIEFYDEAGVDYGHWSSGFAVALLISTFIATFLACVVATLATVLLASVVSASLAVTLLACVVALATLAAIAARVASEQTL